MASINVFLVVGLGLMALGLGLMILAVMRPKRRDGGDVNVGNKAVTIGGQSDQSITIHGDVSNGASPPAEKKPNMGLLTLGIVADVVGVGAFIYGLLVAAPK